MHWKLRQQSLLRTLRTQKCRLFRSFFRVFKKIFCLEFLLLEGAKTFCRRIRHKSLEKPPLYSDNENQYTGLKVQVNRSHPDRHKLY